MPTDPERIKLLLGAALHKALATRPDRDPRRDLQTGEKLWTRAAGPMVDYLYSIEAAAVAPTLSSVTYNGSYTDHGIQVDTSGSAFYNLAITSGSLDMYNHNIINLATPINNQDASTKAYVDQNFDAMKEPTGFPNLTDSSFNFSGSNGRVFEIKATGATFDYYIHGQKYTISGSSAEISDTEGTHYIYLDEDNYIHTSTIFSKDLFLDHAIASIVYWDATNKKPIYLAEERHGIAMDGITHAYLHETVGTRYESGLALNTLDADGSGDDATAAQFGYTEGVIWDEDLEIELPADTSPANIPIFYKLGVEGNWRTTTATDYPLVYGADYAGTLAAWNELDGSEWKLSEVSNLQFVLTHYFATNCVGCPVIGICGQATYNTVANARLGAATELNDLVVDGLPQAEFKSIATVIFQTSNSYDNVPKSRIRTTDTGVNWIDWRFEAGAPSAGGQVNDHGQLTGLEHDDHLRYYNAQRLAGVVSGSNHPTSSDLDHITDNGNTTTNNIIVGSLTASTSGSWFKDTAIEGEFTVHGDHLAVLGGDIKTDWDVFANSFVVNKDFKIIEAQVIFRKPTSGYEILQWDHNNNYFNFTDTLKVDGDLQVDNDLQVDGDLQVEGEVITGATQISGSLAVDGSISTNADNIKINQNGPNASSYIHFYDNTPTGQSLKWEATRFRLTSSMIMNGYLRTEGDIHINWAGGTDPALYFYADSSDTGASLIYDTDPGQFVLSDSLDMGTHKITSVVDPTDDQDAATKKYVDDNATGSGSSPTVVALYPNSRLASNWAWSGTDEYIQSGTLITGDQTAYCYLTMPDNAASVKITGQMRVVSTEGCGLDGTVYLERKVTTGSWTSLGNDTDTITHVPGGGDTTTPFVWEPSFTLDWVDGAQYRLRFVRNLSTTTNVSIAYVNIYGVSVG